MTSPRHFFPRAQPGFKAPKRRRRVQAGDPLQPSTQLAERDAAPRPLLTVEQARVYLGLESDKAVYARVYRGEIPCRRIGRTVRFDQDELEAATRKHREGDAETLALVISHGRR